MRWLSIAFLTVSVLTLSVSYSPGVAIASSVGASIGAYLGENLSVPILMFSSKLGLIDEGEIFSPFSTLIYDSMEVGFVLGVFFGGALIDMLLNPSPWSVLLDSIACSLILGIDDSRVKRKLSIVVSSVLGGIVW